MRNERGSALVLAMFILLLAGSVSAVILERGRGLDAATQDDRENLRAFYAAEAGLARARHALAQDAAYAGETLTVADRTVTIEVDGWSVAVVTPGCRLEATLAPSHGLPRVVTWRERP